MRSTATNNVADAVRRRVLSIADELRYSPHHAARSLSSRRTHTIGVVLPDLHGEFFSELMRGIDQVARERGLHLLVSSYHGHPEEQGAALRAMRGRVDGLLVMSPYAGEADFLTGSLSPSLPTVLINTHLPEAGFGVLSIDNHGGARAMVRHLVDSGHRRIAFIAGPEDNFDAHERLRGYRDALAEALPDAQPWVLAGRVRRSIRPSAPGVRCWNRAQRPGCGLRRQRHDGAGLPVRLQPGRPARARTTSRSPVSTTSRSRATCIRH